MNSRQNAEIRELIEKGYDSRDIASRIGVSVQTVAAVRAHITMGTYGTVPQKSNATGVNTSVTEKPIQTYSPVPQLDREIDALEKRTRDNIDAVLSAKSEDYLSLIPSDIVESVHQKINEHLKRHPYEKNLFWSNRARLDFMDVMDYCKIILSNWKYFSENFGSKTEVEKHFLNIKEVRNALKHGRVVNAVVRKQGEASTEWLSSILKSDLSHVKMLTASEKRQIKRRNYVDNFLREIGVKFDSLAPPTRACLLEWARQTMVVEDQPSANFGNLILELCKAVESELAARPCQIPILSLLNSGTLGDKAAFLARTELDGGTKQLLEIQGMKPDFIKSDLPRLLSRLETLRCEFNAARGDSELHRASLQEANEARRIVGEILSGLTGTAA